MSENNENFQPQMSLSDVRLRNGASKTNMLYSILVWQYRSDCIVAYDKRQFVSQKIKEKKSEQMKLAGDTYKGDLSKQGISKIRKLFDIWLEGINVHNNGVNYASGEKYHRLTMITLTLSASQRHTDKIIKEKLLKPYLRILRENYNCKNYLWKAETQKNGNIHFHLAIDVFVNKHAVQVEWNRIQNKLSYIDRFYQKHGHKNPPSTQIEAIKDWKNMSKYFAKYISKSVGGRPIEGAVWNCSNNLRKLKYFEIDSSSTEQELLLKKVSSKDVEIVALEQCNIVKLKKCFKRQLMSDYSKSLHDCYLSVLLLVLFGDDINVDFENTYRALLLAKGLVKTDKESVISKRVKAAYASPPVQLSFFEETFDISKFRN